MIQLTRLGTRPTPIAINADLIEMVEELPDTTITLTNGNKLLVRERMRDVIDRVVAFRGRILAERERWLASPGGGDPV